MNTQVQQWIKGSPKLESTTEDYQRLEYTLKMNLSLINGRFKDMTIYHVNANMQMETDLAKDSVNIECMELITQQNTDEVNQLLSKKGRLNISRNKPKKFTFGSVLSEHNTQVISEDRDFYILVFKVNVGKSYI